MPRQRSIASETYSNFLNDLKQRIHEAQVRAAFSVNQELIMLYWHIGREIICRQQQEGWGAKVVEQLSDDLQKEFPDMTGFSRRNLKYMRSFASAYPDLELVQRCIALIPWRHNLALLEKLKSQDERIWYAEQALENGWSRDVLVLQIETRLYHRQGEAMTNFSRTLPSPQSDLAQQLIKDPYNFDFLTLNKHVQERELENALVDHIRDFLLELGVGFAFIGSQYPLVVDGKDYRLDLLLYHVKLHCYVIIDLKIGEFEPEFSGKMNFYVSAVEHLLRDERDEHTIGIILCRSKHKTTVEFALQDIQKPIGVATYQLGRELPKALQDSLPTPEQLEMELDAAATELEARKSSAD